jgi:4-hydroxy-3-methylbut-2-enyl diphosphate reductase
MVHHGREVARLREQVLNTIDHAQFAELRDAHVLLRAHGEPPATYALAEQNQIHLIDATCPVVLHLQERIKREYIADAEHRKQIVIFGKRGHAEVLGLVGQTEGTAIVIETPEEAAQLDFTRDIALYSQTTKSLEGFRQVVEYIQAHIAHTATFTYSDTICRQVANRMPHIRDFAAHHDIVLFVCGRKSSNGRVLFGECQRVNPNSYMIDDPSEIEERFFATKAQSATLSIGICGATSTPKWLMEQCRDHVKQLLSL